METRTRLSYIKKALKEIRTDLKSKSIVSILSVGGIAGMTRLLFVSAFATLLFQNSLPEYVPQLTVIFFLSGAMANLILVFFSNYKAIINTIQDSPAAILSITVSNIVVGMATYSKTEVYYTALAAIALTTLITGVLLILLGRFKLGGIIRFLPYPVIGGFIAGTGWLLFTGGIGILVDQSFSMELIRQLFSSELIIRWLPIALIGLGMVIAQRRFNHPMLLPIGLFSLTVIFYLYLLLSGTSLAAATQSGLLFEIAESTRDYKPLLPAAFPLVHWREIFFNFDTIITVLFTSIAAVMLTITSIEVTIRKPLDANHELQTIGISNIIGGLMSASVSYPSLSLSMIGKRLKVESRLSGIITSLIQITAFLIGAQLIGFIPIPIIGLSVIIFGLFFLVEWLWDGLFNLSRWDYVIVATILGVIAFTGFIQGVIIGLLLTLILNVINYSQVNIIWHESFGTKIKSNLQRATRYQTVLEEFGDQMHVYKLRGFLFFGTANQLLQSLRNRLENSTLPPIKYIILDFKQVHQIDSSAQNNLSLMSFMADSFDFNLIFCGVAKDQTHQLEKLGFKTNPHIKFFHSLDQGIEWAEDQILLNQGRGSTQMRTSLKKLLQEDNPDFTDLDKIMSYMEIGEYQIGDEIITQNNSPEAIFIVESGQVAVHIAGENSEVRVQAMGEGTLVGELQVYLDTNATASVVVTRPAVIYRFSIEALKKLEKDHPKLASEFHRYVVQVIGKRLLTNNFILKEFI